MTESAAPDPPPALSPALAHVLRCLELEALDRDLFLGDPGPGTGRLFGGMVAAQSVMAAGHTVEPERQLHSLHAYFLRPGGHDRPLRFLVDRIRDGRSFTTRRVKAHQSGEAIFALEASYALPEDGIEHQDPMPEVPPPEQCVDRESARLHKLGEEWQHHPVNAVEVRVTDDRNIAGGDAHAHRTEPRQLYWMRLRGTIAEPGERLLTALFVYASDRALLSTAALPHGVHWGKGMAASLDHALWIHRPTDLHDWHLFSTESPAAFAGRGIVFGGIFRRDGSRVASVAQEALIRPPR
ncbi:MAG TPA: acyl-CoA thioesterase domain-containing protein [Thermoanaerobaculia bacterium]|nr:acyl-CoA thioesterase domain-containing protein [Thermoanaerobaculia bacterium]